MSLSNGLNESSGFISDTPETAKRESVKQLSATPLNSICKRPDMEKPMHRHIACYKKSSKYEENWTRHWDQD